MPEDPATEPDNDATDAQAEPVPSALPTASQLGRQLSRQKKILFGGILLVVFLVGQEVVLRLLFPVPEIANFNRVQYSQMFHGESGKQPGADKFLANASYIHASDPDGAEFVHSLNLYGFRDRQWSLRKPAGQRRFMFVGDSFVEGAMASDEYTIPEGFRAAAEESNQTVDTMNMGVQAMGLTGYMFLMADAVPLFKPDVVFIVLFENDFHAVPPFNPALLEGRMKMPEVNSAWTPRLVQLLENISKGRPVARRWTTAPFSFFAALPNQRNPFANPQVDRLYSQFVDPAVAAAMKAGRFNPYLVDEYAFDCDVLRKPVNVSSFLLAYKDFLEKHGCQLYLAYIPLNHQVSDHYIPYALKFSRNPGVGSLMAPEFQVHQQNLAIQCDVLEIPLLDFTPILRELEAKGNHLYWDYDNHMRGEAYFLIGSELYDWFMSLQPDKQKP